MTWRLRIDRHAARKIKRLDANTIRRVVQCIRELATDPRPTGSKQLKESTSRGWRVRTGKYRILYVIDDNSHEVTVYEVGLRDQVYRRKK